MAFRVTIHQVAKPDLEALRKAGLSRLIERARKKMHSLAEEKHPALHTKVTKLEAYPRWYRYRDGNTRIIFRFTKSEDTVANVDTLQITMIDLRDEKTYEVELDRRYRQLEDA